MDFENFRAAFYIRQRHKNLAVETARPCQCLVENIGAVGRRYDDHLIIGIKAVHLDKNGVERLLAFIVAAADKSRAAFAADGVYFIEEDDAGRIFLCLLEQVSNARCAYADKHFDKVAARDAEKRHFGFARDGLCQKRLAAAGRADKQNAARDTAAEALEFLGIFQKFDDFGDFILGLVNARDILEINIGMFFAVDRCLLLPKLVSMPPGPPRRFRRTRK